MKHCPTCGATYGDDFDFCLQDGARLNSAPNQNQFPTVPYAETPTVFSSPQQTASGGSSKKFFLIGFIAVLFLALGIGGTLFFMKNQKDEKVSVANTSNSATATPSAANTAATASPTPTPTPTPNKAQLQKLINDKIKSILAAESLEEAEKEYRKIVYGDLDGDGDEDAVVHYGWSFIGGNGWGTSMMALTSENGEYKFAADEPVGEKLGRSTVLKSIKGGKILLDTSSYAEDDAACCPSIKGGTVYVLKGGKLIETKK